MLIYLDIDGVMVPANSWRKLEILEDDNKDSGVKNHLLKVMSAIAS